MSSGKSAKIKSAFTRPFKNLLNSSKSAKAVDVDQSEPLDFSQEPAWRDFDTDEDKLKSIVAFYAPVSSKAHEDTLDPPDFFLEMSRIYMELGGSFEVLVSAGKAMTRFRHSPPLRKHPQHEIVVWEHQLCVALTYPRQLPDRPTDLSDKLIVSFFEQTRPLMNTTGLTSEEVRDATVTAHELGYGWIQDINWVAQSFWQSTKLPGPVDRANLADVEMSTNAGRSRTGDTLEENFPGGDAPDQATTSEGDEPHVQLSAKAKGKMPVRLSGPVKRSATTVNPDDDDL